MNSRTTFNLFEIDRIDFNNIPDGANYIIDNNMKPVAVLMSAQYYRYLEQLMIKLKDKIINMDKSKE